MPSRPAAILLVSAAGGRRWPVGERVSAAGRNEPTLDAPILPAVHRRSPTFPEVLLKLDTHVHSSHSGYSSISGLSRLMRESYNSPEGVYRAARARGMDLVTITDHDRIDGALTIADRPDVIVGCEVTGVFPGDGVRVHLGVLGLNEAQFAVSETATAVRVAQNRTAAQLATIHGKVGIAGSDCHTMRAIGGGPCQQMHNLTTGHVCAAGDAEAFAVAAARLLRDAGRRAVMGAAARHLALGRTWDAAMRPLFRAWEEAHEASTAGPLARDVAAIGAKIRRAS